MTLFSFPPFSCNKRKVWLALNGGGGKRKKEIWGGNDSATYVGLLSSKGLAGKFYLSRQRGRTDGLGSHVSPNISGEEEGGKSGRKQGKKLFTISPA